MSLRGAFIVPIGKGDTRDPQNYSGCLQNKLKQKYVNEKEIREMENGWEAALPRRAGSQERSRSSPGPQPAHILSLYRVVAPGAEALREP